MEILDHDAVFCSVCQHKQLNLSAPTTAAAAAATPSKQPQQQPRRVSTYRKPTTEQPTTDTHTTATTSQQQQQPLREKVTSLTSLLKSRVEEKLGQASAELREAAQKAQVGGKGLLEKAQQGIWKGIDAALLVAQEVKTRATHTLTPPRGAGAGSASEQDDRQQQQQQRVPAFVLAGAVSNGSGGGSGGGGGAGYFNSSAAGTTQAADASFFSLGDEDDMGDDSFPQSPLPSTTASVSASPAAAATTVPSFLTNQTPQQPQRTQSLQSADSQTATISPDSNPFRTSVVRDIFDTSVNSREAVYTHVAAGQVLPRRSVVNLQEWQKRQRGLRLFPARKLGKGGKMKYRYYIYSLLA